MASSMVKFFSEIFLNKKCAHSPLLTIVRHTSIKKKPKPERGTIKHRNLIKSRFESLAARGFLRSYKPYNPKEKVKEIVLGFCNKVLGTNFDQDLPLSREDKFVLLNMCFKELNHSVPNSMLHKIISIDNIIKFYETPVSTSTPYDELKNQELPPNLHVIYDYVRFNPENDVKFKGISAFPKSSNIITGLRYKEKYKEYRAESPFFSCNANDGRDFQKNR